MLTLTHPQHKVAIAMYFTEAHITPTNGCVSSYEGSYRTWDGEEDKKRFVVDGSKRILKSEVKGGSHDVAVAVAVSVKRSEGAVETIEMAGISRRKKNTERLLLVWSFPLHGEDLILQYITRAEPFVQARSG